jgi:hypothetical protein
MIRKHPGVDNLCGILGDKFGGPWGTVPELLFRRRELIIEIQLLLTGKWYDKM